MYPTLFQIGSFRLSTYGLMMMTAFVAGIVLAVLRGRRLGMPRGFVQDLSTLILVGSLAGARLIYVLTHLEEFRGNWLGVINPIRTDGNFGIAGLVLLGGVLTAIPLTVWYSRRKGQSVLEVLDLLAPSLALGIAIGRVGCLLNGCCFGRACSLPWAIHYPAESHLHGVGLHPTQAYSILINLALMFLLLRVARRRRFQGQVFGLFLLIYSPGRFLVEFFRDYEAGMILARFGSWDFTTSQLLTFVMFLAAIALYRSWKERGSPSGGEEPGSSGGERHER